MRSIVMVVLHMHRNGCFDPEYHAHFAELEASAAAQGDDSRISQAQGPYGVHQSASSGKTSVDVSTGMKVQKLESQWMTAMNDVYSETEKQKMQHMSNAQAEKAKVANLESQWVKAAAALRSNPPRGDTNKGIDFKSHDVKPTGGKLYTSVPGQDEQPPGSTTDFGYTQQKEAVSSFYNWAKQLIRSKTDAERERLEKGQSEVGREMADGALDDKSRRREQEALFTLKQTAQVEEQALLARQERTRLEAEINMHRMRSAAESAIRAPDALHTSHIQSPSQAYGRQEEMKRREMEAMQTLNKGKVTQDESVNDILKKVSQLEYQSAEKEVEKVLDRVRAMEAEVEKKSEAKRVRIQAQEEEARMREQEEMRRREQERQKREAEARAVLQRVSDMQVNDVLMRVAKLERQKQEQETLDVLRRVQEMERERGLDISSGQIRD
jgi:hypothetical protein